MKNSLEPHFTRRELVLILILFSTVVVVITGIQMEPAIFPALSRLFGVPLGEVTFLTSIWAFTGILSPLFGLLSDRYGHTASLLAGLGVFAVANLLCAVAPSFTSLLVFQIPVGLGYAVFNFSVPAVVGDAFAYEARARALGMVRVAVSAAALVGVPAAAAIAGRLTARGSFGAVATLGLGVLAVAFALLPRLTGGTTAISPGTARGSWQTVVEIARRRSAVASVLAVLGWAAVETGFFIYLAAWLEQAFRLTETQIGLAFSLAGAGALAGNALTAAWSDRLGKKRAAIVGLLVLSAAAPLLPHSPNIAAALVGVGVFAAALEFGYASFSALMTELIPHGRGTLMSLISLANGLGAGLVPLLVRPLWENGGYTSVTLALGGVGLGVALVIGLLIVDQPL